MSIKKVKILLGSLALAIIAALSVTTYKAYSNYKQDMSALDDAYAKDINLNLSDNDVKSEQDIMVFYDQCATEADTLKMVNGENVDYQIRDYKAPVFFEYMQGLDYNYEVNEEEGYVANDTRVVSDNYEFTEDGKLLVRDMKMNTSIPVIKYLRVAANEVEARYISAAASNESNLVSGLTFVMEQNELGYYKLTGLQGVFGEDASHLRYYEGTFDGWAMEMNGQPVYEAGDEVKISGDMTLYPHFMDNEASKNAKADGTCLDDMIEEIDGCKVLRVIHIKGTKRGKDGNLVATDKKYALTDFDKDKDTVRTTGGKVIDRDTIVSQQTEDGTEAKKEETKPTEAKPGKEKPQSSKPSSGGNGGNGGGSTPAPQPQPTKPADTIDRSTEIGEQPVTDGYAPDGWDVIDMDAIMDYDFGYDLGIDFE